MATVLAAVVTAACSTPPGRSGPPRAEPPPRHAPATQTGRASWYGEPHHGHLTASGEVYDMNRLTAAHPTLPFGTRVLVTNLANNRSVEVRVNDRGPFTGGRIIDLSYAAAQVLHAVNAGVFAVRVAVIER